MSNDALMILLGSAIPLSAPLILSAMGGLLSERSGVINIALEGMMLSAACLAAVVGFAANSAFAGLAAGIGAAVCMGLLHALLTQAYRLDHIVSGMAINALALGGTNVLRSAFIHSSSTDLPSLPLWFYWVCALVAPFILWWLLRATKPGLRLLATGEDPSKARQMGVATVQVRYLALAGAGVLCGLSGVLIASNSGNFTDGMTAGRGFIALAALILGGWRPLWALGACLAFGFLEAIQLQLQGSKFFGAELPSPYWNAMPYAITLIALAGFLGRGRAPAGLGKE